MNVLFDGRPITVTQHFGDPAPLKGQSCNAKSTCCDGTGRHDSQYVCVKFDGQYFPCPPCEQPNYDEIVVFNSDAVLPVVASEFKLH